MARGPGLPAIAVALVVALACSEKGFAQEPEPTVDELAVRAVVEGFKGALAAGDSTAALGYLHRDLVVYEAGEAETLAEYRASHLSSDMEFAAAVETTILQQGVIVRPGMALWVSESESKGEFRGQAIDAHGAETIILLPTDAGWKILHVHWSSR
ncbi:MAG TPA: nuclear transport factor 2 family protein [Gemmatimonadota bacterium]|jgi:ketosteroid isomerase-like protein|nr:nuclear transport factor 2 family protein [Gemmatimonadota bacterium]